MRCEPELKTLVIHMDDRSTDFLEEIYYNKAWAVIDDDRFTKKELKIIIDSYDRIVMLGHGSPDGLFGEFGRIIDDSFGELLKTKETVCIWCNADQFVKKHDLKGFYTGMFISELHEAYTNGILNSTEDEIEESNYLFAFLMNDYIFHENVLQEMKYHYWLDNDPVYAYNNERMYEN